MVVPDIKLQKNTENRRQSRLKPLEQRVMKLPLRDAWVFKKQNSFGFSHLRDTKTLGVRTPTQYSRHTHFRLCYYFYL